MPILNLKKRISRVSNKIVREWKKQKPTRLPEAGDGGQVSLGGKQSQGFLDKYDLGSM
jgi:hypothetical protein